MTLKEQLEQQKASFIVRVPEEAQAAIFRHIHEQQQSGEEYGLKQGDTAPNFSLMNPLGEEVVLYDELVRTPVVLVFYRGGWCPYCNIQLRAYQKNLPEIEKYGARLIAISPQSPDKSLSQKEKEQLTFQVLSDPHGRVADCYKLLFELPEYLQNALKNVLGLDLISINKTNRWVLPIPATYVIDKKGIIRYADVNPDFMKRMEPEDIISQLKKI